MIAMIKRPRALAGWQWCRCVFCPWSFCISVVENQERGRTHYAKRKKARGFLLYYGIQNEMVRSETKHTLECNETA